MTKASANVAALFYQLIGDTAGADALRAGSGNRTAAKLVLAAVALAVGVGGIWLFFWGLNAVVMRLSAMWRGRLLPWVFVGPALAAADGLPGVARRLHHHQVADRR